MYQSESNNGGNNINHNHAFKYGSNNTDEYCSYNSLENNGYLNQELMNAINNTTEVDISVSSGYHTLGKFFI
jgi:hypothetical protein